MFLNDFDQLVAKAEQSMIDEEIYSIIPYIVQLKMYPYQNKSFQPGK